VTVVREWGRFRSRETRRPDAEGVDAAALADDLRRVIDGEVRFSPGDRALWSHDSSNFRHVPLGAVLPAHAEDVVRGVAVCRAHGAPVFARGGGTSLSGQTTNSGVVFDFSKHMTELVELNAEERWARVQPGLILDHLRDAAEEHHLTFGPDPSTHDRCVMGGVLGNDSCGTHSVMAGKAVDNVIEMDVLTYDGTRMTVGATSDEDLEAIIHEGGRRGEIYANLKRLGDRYADLVRERYPNIPRRVSGYNLDDLLPERGFDVARALIGSESTCVFILEAKVRLVPSPPARSLLVLGYPDVFSAADHVPQILELGPIGLEGLDDELIAFAHRKGLHEDELRLLPEGSGGWLLVEFGADTTEEADAKAKKLMDKLSGADDSPQMELLDDPVKEQKLWTVREAGLGATAFVPGRPDAWEGWEDAAVPPERLGAYLRDFKELIDRYGYDTSVYGHFGDGCVHCRLPFDLETAEGLRKYRSFMCEAADLVVSYGGSLSGEHGDGQQRGELLPKMFGAEIVDAFREFKRIWDPEWKMNPGKLIDAHRFDEDLKLGADYNPPSPATHFSYPEDEGNFAHATIRCVGVGKCRSVDEGIMCPSYMVTREEKHSTRGRSRMLFEMLEGGPVDKGWRDESVKEALDLCLACKGCKNECPVNVDMATYKAEFLSHYYAGRLRPVQAYALGLIYWWARLAAQAPGLANLVTHAPVLGRIVKLLGGVASERDAPFFAAEPFTDWFVRRDPVNRGGKKVLLWPDTFNNYFHSEVTRSAAQVLEHFGCEVMIPSRPLCCGRPLYDFGMVGTAKRLLRQLLDVMRDDIREGVPLVGVEPSCLAVFRDELTNLFPHDEDARRLKEQSFTLAEFLEGQGWEMPRLERKIIMQPHCHHKSVMGITQEQKVLAAMGADYEVLDAGCCGLAGSFGFEAGEKYEVSVAAGERSLLPKVRASEDSTFISSDGFSCRTQIEQLGGRRSLHLAQIIQSAIDHGPSGPATRRPEDAYPPAPAGLTPRDLRTTLFAAGFFGGAVLVKRALSRRRSARRWP
jgi:FAD/FMN-containing dehydrogenase/Fe-S oxidoreductase